jgi:hypothetical protein
MKGLHMTELAEGEEILFGPVRKTSKINLTVKSETTPGRATHTSFRTVCITNQRVIIETGDSAINYPAKDIQTVFIKRKKDKKKKEARFHILQIRTKRGHTVKFEIPDISSEKETLLKQVFPSAAITESRGIGGFLDRVLGG